jgi:micrococcal nuclease
MIPDYQYKATVIDVHDGDTVRLDVDLGFRVHFNLQSRLYGINAPELNTVEGRRARSHLLFLLGAGDATPTNTIYLRTIKDGQEKYGRYLAELFRRDLPGMPSVNQLMVSDGFAVAYNPSGGRDMETL